jgi:hypothetical protein
VKQETLSSRAREISVSIPEKHFPKWLQIQSHLTKLRLWIGFAKFVLTLATIAGLTIYVGNKSTEALKDLLPIIGAIGSLAGAAIGVHKYLNRDRRDDD